MPIEIKRYKEWLADQAEQSRESGHLGDHCFVAGCDNPGPYYVVGDERFWCGMCETHAGMTDNYREYVKNCLSKLGFRRC